jgi:iron complex transport system substrate-binding protein
VLADIHQPKVDMSTEMILARQPEVLIELQYGNSLRADNLETERAVWNALPSLPAVKNNRVHLLVGNEFVVPGPRVVLAAERLARTLHRTLGELGQ